MPETLACTHNVGQHAVRPERSLLIHGVDQDHRVRQLHRANSAQIGEARTGIDQDYVRAGLCRQGLDRLTHLFEAARAFFRVGAKQTVEWNGSVALRILQVICPRGEQPDAAVHRNNEPGDLLRGVGLWRRQHVDRAAGNALPRRVELGDLEQAGSF